MSDLEPIIMSTFAIITASSVIWFHRSLANIFTIHGTFKFDPRHIAVSLIEGQFKIFIDTHYAKDSPAGRNQSVTFFLRAGV